MRIFNQDKTKELTEIDETKGYLKNDKLLIEHINAVEEQGHFETIAEYENGGKDVNWVVDVAGVKEHDVFEDIQVYVPFTKKELAQIEIMKLKGNLMETDYQAIKFAEGLISAEDYEPIKQQRQTWRNKINELEGGL